MEKALVDYLFKRYGQWEKAVVVNDNGKTICVELDFGDDEIITATVNRRDGYNGNYRIVCEA